MSSLAKHEEKKNYILDHGLDIIWDKGYNGASVSDIVKAAGVPKGSFYNYFESKEDFVVQALERYFRKFFLEGLLILDDESLSSKERLYKHYEYRVKLMLTNPQFTRGCMACSMGSEMSNHSEAIRLTLKNKEALIKGKMADTVKKAQDDGEIHRDLAPEEIISFIEDAFKGAITTRKEFKDDQPLKNFLKVVKNIMLR